MPENPLLWESCYRRPVTSGGAADEDTAGDPERRISQQVRVAFDYPVVFTRGALRADNDALRRAIARREPDRRHRVFAVIDAGLADARPGLADELAAYVRRHDDALALVAEPMRVPGGEAAKNDPAVITGLLGAFFGAGLDRHSCVLVIGGGAVLDAVGYAAAICHRGLRTVRMPSTVLAQDDAGIGVKNGVNAFGVKNAVGVFAPPHAVVNDLELLATLPARERTAGLAEAVKVALIRDPAFFAAIEREAPALVAGRLAPLAAVIRRCAELHLRHIRDSGDPFETGSARPLDFGHWAAHRLELLSEHALRHGEAVALGVALDSTYSAAVGRLDAGSLARILDLLAALRLPAWSRALVTRIGGPTALLRGLEEFREHLGGELTITLLDDIGRGIEVHAVDHATMTECVERLAGAE
jgi:3-dehydroquinate synthase